MRIAVCDDEKIITEELKNIIMQILDEKQIQAEVDGYESGRQLIDNANRYEGIFLDMDMPEMDGIEVAKRIRTINNECVIIIATAREDRYREAFHISASDFITKPFISGEVETAIDIIINSGIGKEKIMVYKKANKFDIRQRDIETIEAYDGYVLLFSQGVEYRRETTIKDIKTEINNEMFMEVRRGKIVNLLHVDKYKNGTIFIKDREIKVARNKKKEFEKKYLEFDLKYRTI